MFDLWACNNSTMPGTVLTGVLAVALYILYYNNYITLYSIGDIRGTLPCTWRAQESTERHGPLPEVCDGENKISGMYN